MFPSFIFPSFLFFSFDYKKQNIFTAFGSTCCVVKIYMRSKIYVIVLSHPNTLFLCPTSSHTALLNTVAFLVSPVSLPHQSAEVQFSTHFIMRGEVEQHICLSLFIYFVLTNLIPNEELYHLDGISCWTFSTVFM